MKTINPLLAAALGAAFALGATGAVGATASKDNQRSARPAPAGAPIIVLVPTQIAASDSLGNGCWARLYDGTNFQGNQLSLVGPVDMPSMRTAFGTDWGGEFDSIAVGPKATVTVYDNENYRDRAQTFKSGQKVADMGGKMGLFEDVRSLKIACAGGAPTARMELEQGAGASAGASASPQSRFDALDADNDGTLSRSEYEKL